MRKCLFVLFLIMATAPLLMAQEFDNVIDTPADESTVQEKDTGGREQLKIGPLTFSGTVDMQVDKKMYDEFYDKSGNRFNKTGFNTSSYRAMVDDFWMRVALRMKYELKNVESALALRFYPYWALRRKDEDSDLGEMKPQLDLTEVNQAYLKLFKDYRTEENHRFHVHFKVGRDGMLNSCSQLFGNYLDNPIAGYGDGNKPNVIGPFKNKKVFANQLEVGFSFKLDALAGVKGVTSMMFGNNVNNDTWYTSPSPAISQLMDVKLSAGFIRLYQDFYIWDDRIHLGTGYRDYTTKIEDENGAVVDSRYINAAWAFDITFLPDFKFYSEFAYQKIGAESSTGIIRPCNAGITFPTGGLLDVLAIEVENVGETFFSDVSMRDKINNRFTRSLAWGIVVEKWFVDRIGIAWGLYSGNPSGDMKTSFRLTSNFN